MTTPSNGLKTTSAVPAFVSNQRSRNSSITRNRSNKNLNDCCYSIANLALIAAAIVGIIFTVKFFNDDPLYDIGDYLLSLRFYRQLVYIIVILPLILLVPFFNATSAFFLSDNSKQEIGKSLISVRIIYQILLVILVFIALAFIAPSIKASSVATQIDFEIKKHIYRRYDNQFSFEFLDKIQVQYQCCDQNYYVSNYHNNLPLSCFIQDGFYSHVHKYTCSEVLGHMVSNRCMVLTVCFIIILFALASLIAMDVIEIVNLSGRNYNVWEHESKRAATLPLNSNNSNNNSINNNDEEEEQQQQQQQDDIDSIDNDDFAGVSLDNVDILTSDEISNRLKLHERERDTPLLPKLYQYQQKQIQKELNERRNNNNNNRDFRNVPDSSSNKNQSMMRKTSPILLTRANYLTQNNQRPQSPIFISNSNISQPTAAGSVGINQSGAGGSFRASQHQVTPAKSVLKKSTSFSRIDTTEEEEQEDDEVLNYLKQFSKEKLRSEQLSVRFAE